MNLPCLLIASLSCCVIASIALAKSDDSARSPEEGDSAAPPVLRETITTITGESVPMSTYAGKTLLLVNVASNCGYTGQYEGLQALYEEFGQRGLVVIGFPCNQFKNQEPGSDEEIQAFCQQRYGVTFPLSTKIKVNGAEAHPLYQYLTRESPLDAPANASQDAPPIEDQGPVQWNFEKFLVAPSGEVVARFRSEVTPESDTLREAVEAALATSKPASAQ